MTTYAGFTIERTRSGWIARRTTRTANFQLAPARSRREIEHMIDKYNATLTWEQLVAA